MRQKVRRTILFIAFLLFPVTIWYFSPALIIQAASEHIMNGSFFVFMAMLAASLFLGRAWCGWLCPAGGMQECLIRCNDKPAKQGWRNHIKYVIWVIWITLVIVTFILGKNKVTVDFFYPADSCAARPDPRPERSLPLPVLDGALHGHRQHCRPFPASAPAAY